MSRPQTRESSTLHQWLDSGLRTATLGIDDIRVPWATEPLPFFLSKNQTYAVLPQKHSGASPLDSLSPKSGKGATNPKDGLSDEIHHRSRRLVRLCEHGDARLRHDLVARELHHLVHRGRVRTQQFQRQSGALDRISEAVERLLHRLPLTGGEVERLAALGDRDLLACVNSRLAQRLDTNHARRGLRRA